MIKLSNLLEKTIGKVSQQINIVMQLDKTKHASERQFRHGKPITDDEIRRLAEKAATRIGKMMIFNEIDVNQRIIIKDKNTNLQILGVLEKKGDILDLVIISLMRDEDFRNIKNTKIIEI